MIRDSRLSSMEVSTAQIFCSDFFARCGFDQGRACEEDCPIAFDNNRFIRHCWNISAACCTGTTYGCDLRNPLSTHNGLISEDPPKVISIREYLVLHRKEGTTRIDQVDARKVIGVCNFLCPDVFFDCHWVV